VSSRHVTSRYVTSRHVMSLNIPSGHNAAHRIMSYNFTLHNVT